MGQISLSPASFRGTKKDGHMAENGVLARGFDMFWTWRERHRSRAELIGMPDGMLKDIGLSRGDAELEYEKPFWRS